MSAEMILATATSSITLAGSSVIKVEWFPTKAGWAPTSKARSIMATGQSPTAIEIGGTIKEATAWPSASNPHPLSQLASANLCLKSNGRTTPAISSLNHKSQLNSSFKTSSLWSLSGDKRSSTGWNKNILLSRPMLSSKTLMPSKFKKGLFLSSEES